MWADQPPVAQPRAQDARACGGSAEVLEGACPADANPTDLPLAQPGELHSCQAPGGARVAEVTALGEAMSASSFTDGPPASTGCELPVDAEDMIAEFKRLLAVNDDVFPVPWLPPPPPPQSRSRRPRARYAQCMAVRQVAERSWLSLNQAGAYVPGEARSGEGRPVRLGSANLREQHAAIWKMLMN